MRTNLYPRIVTLTMLKAWFASELSVRHCGRPRIFLGTNSRVLFVLVALMLSACTTLPGDLGRSSVSVLTAEHGRAIPTQSPAALIRSLTAETLSTETAISLALVNNSELQARFAHLGFAAADVYEAGRIRNPVFSVGVLDSSRSGGRDQLTIGIVGSFTDLITLPARKRLAGAEYATLKQDIGAAVLDTAAQAQRAYYRYIAAQQTAAMRHQTAKAAALTLEMATRYQDAGNLTPRAYALAQGSAAEGQLEALRADIERYEARAELAAVLGISVSGSWGAPAQLPVPPAHEDPLDDLLALAAESRLDLAAARARVDSLADRLGVTRWTGVLGDADVGLARERESDGARLSGPTLDWDVPIFAQSRGALMRVDAELQLALAEYAGLSMQVQNDVHLAYAATQNARARAATYRDRLIPARIAATNRAQEEENFMLIGIFELIETKQDEYDSYQGYLEIVRDYWLARTALGRAVGKALPGSAHVGDVRLDVDDLIRSQPADTHSGHQGMDHSGDGEQEQPVEAQPENLGAHHHEGD